MFKLPDNFQLIFQFLHGSHLYGTSTPSSDVDLRGVFIPSREYFHGFLNKVEQFEEKSTDTVFYELRKFLALALDSNPNIIEFLFVPSNYNTEHLIITPEWEHIMENRGLFLSSKARWTFSGYAVSQLNRLKKHRKWLLYGENIVEPNREDYGLPVNRKLITTDQIGAFNVILANRLQEIGQLHELKDKLLEMEDTVDYIGIVQSMTEAKKSVEHVVSLLPEINENFIRSIQMEKQYAQNKREYDQYVNWKKTRNLERFKLEEKFKYDCYTEETEFLTETGWKLYDDIKSEKLGTLNPVTFEIEYQDYINRVKYPVNNEPLMYFSNQYSQFFVTENHNCFVSRAHRKESNNFSFNYDKKFAKWEFKSIHNMLNDRFSHYHIIHACNNNTPDYNVTDDYLKLMGLYVSEGSILKYNKNPRGISLSQLNGKKNKILKILNSIQEFSFTTTTHYRKSKNRKEDIYNFNIKNIALELLNDCGEYSKNKTLPNWITLLSKRQCDILLTSLLAGDGTFKKYSCIYYTSSKNLADMVNILALTAGYITKVWYYPDFDNMYQVYIKKNKQFGNLKISKGKGKHTTHFKKIKYTGNVVCFEVPNTVLITRYKGEVSFQGNTKHGSHCYRLITEGEELLKTGIITFPRPDRELLTAIRNGCWSFDELMERVENVDKVFDKLYAETILPKTPDKVGVDKICQDIVRKFLFMNG